MEDLITELIRTFFLISGSMDGDFCVNDINLEYVESIVDEQCVVKLILNESI